MKRKTLFLILGFAFLAGGALCFWPEASLFFVVESCLDAGGSYNFEAAHCDFKQSHPVLPALKSSINSPLLGLVLSGVGFTFLLAGVRSGRNMQPNKAFKRTDAPKFE